MSRDDDLPFIPDPTNMVAKFCPLIQIGTLKTAARESEATTVVDIVRRLFNLQDKKAAKSGGDSGAQS